MNKVKTIKLVVVVLMIMTTIIISSIRVLAEEKTSTSDILYKSSISKKQSLSSNKGVKTDYLENYREQYHYSPAKAWANDPNGMVYFKGEYHLFYQYNPDDVVWGPMHWGHAVSKDLIHWKELPIALYPDKGGTIYSGSAVVDKDNTSGFFDGIKGGGLVAIFTQDYLNDKGIEKQKQSIAYSKDNGRTWTKYEGNPVISTENDPLNNAAFRDPKVFYHKESGKWMMVVAGGPLRFFSSTDLKHWKPEGMQPEIQTECPDLFKLEVGDSGKNKWVLSEGGRYYRVGDFKEVDGVWKFVPDSDKRIVMNFAKDSYAAQTYSGTDENGTPDGRRIMINWMNNWDYCNNIAPITKTFNGQFTLQSELKLVNTEEGIRLTQQPIKEYKQLRKGVKNFENVTISQDKPNILSDLSGSKYEIVAEFKPDEKTTEFGFKLRIGAGQETIVKYNTKTQEVTIDRSKSGKAPSNSKAFLESYSSKVNKTKDGKIQLNIFVDSSSVELYGNNGEVCGSTQIFPNRSSEGIEVYSLGGKTKATIKYYPLSGIWNNDIKGKSSVLVSLSEEELEKTVGDEFSIYTTTIPTSASQGVTWKFSDPEVLEIVSQDDTQTTFKTKKIGSTTLTATSKDAKAQKTANLNVYGKDTSDIIKDLTNFSTTGSWYVKKDAYVGNNEGDGFTVAEQTNADQKSTYNLEAEANLIDIGSTAGIVLVSQNEDPKKGSIIANVNKNGNYRVFVYTGEFDNNGNPKVKDLIEGTVPKTEDNNYNLKVELKGNHISYWINGELVCDTNQDYYKKGRFGLNVFGGTTEFKNVSFNSTTSIDYTNVEGSGLTFDQTPGNLHAANDSYVVNNGKQKTGVAISDQQIDINKNIYTLEIDSKVLGDWHADNPANGDTMGIVLFSQSDNLFRDGGIVANVNKWGSYSLIAHVKDENGNLKEVNLAGGKVYEAQYNKYKLKVKLEGNRISFWINGELVCDNIQQNYYHTGKLGLIVWNGPSEFKNIIITSDEVTLLK
ncbi:GH32 C-terminal domain-containing protein [Clostridium estertheticum]|uniref:GH32 C-terminal domain-containing protein n=1 Tax=Clostridium estertheticum TaxID=238834 RepID=UPI001C7CE9CE|nr:GH32 C-terminal domain-containing protein [Clostridium estertheticum]MBX4268309.1 GH32 C-terminal domain-containing protein [Clostridium estertheticum]WLC81621.1 GH32 C-terminal domain-containing protein [Clostridium estertheticum]